MVQGRTREAASPVTWQQDMSRAALSIALPDWEWQEGDVAEVEVDWDAGGTFSGGEMTIMVTVEGPDRWGCEVFANDAATRFWMDLMKTGTGSPR